ncbi:MAG TPA: hypothetical protein VFL80_00500 [Thermoanaerobaculia bacterium]|nr:hypothetical protein [Thermoanaerobaculia bacterium]
MSVFADSRHQDATWRGGSQRDSISRHDRRDEGRRYRDNERVTLEGRVTSLREERDGYRVQLDRARHQFWVPSSHLRHRRGGSGLRVGVSIGFGGVFRGGVVYVDDVRWPGDYGYGGGYYDDRYDDRYDNRYDSSTLRGVVDRIDYRRGVIVVRDRRSGRYVTANIRIADRRSRIDLEDLRPGDFVTLSGEWSRGSYFQAYRIDGVRSGRY